MFRSISSDKPAARPGGRSGRLMLLFRRDSCVPRDSAFRIVIRRHTGVLLVIPRSLSHFLRSPSESPFSTVARKKARRLLMTTYRGRSTVGQKGAHLLPTPPQIQKLFDRSGVISEVPKCYKIQIFRGSALTPLRELTALLRPLADGEGVCCPLPRTSPRSRPFGPRFYGSQGLTHTELATLLMIDFKCRPM